MLTWMHSRGKRAARINFEFSMTSHQAIDQLPNEPAVHQHRAPPDKTNGVSRVEVVDDAGSPKDDTDSIITAEGKSPDDELTGSEHTVISKHSRSTEQPSSVSEAKPAVPMSHADLEDVLEGTSLGHFRLEKFVGGGGMGSVFRGTDMRLGRIVAIKVLSRDRTDPETLRRFQNEAQSAARLDHDNIARVYYVGEDRGLHFIVFEFIEGINIRDLVESKGPLPLDEAISYMLQVAEALEHASQRQVVHRDIKPSNILVTTDGRAKLVDMGLARLRMESDREDLTASGVTLGTFDYISPEQARDPRIADVRSDLYSLGCTFYFMLTGRPPFPEGTLLQKLLSHSSERPGDPRLIRPDLDEHGVEIIDKLLAKQPRDRHQQPSELIGELLLMADRLQLPGLNLTGAVWVGSRHSRWSRIEQALPWLLPAVLLFLSVFALERLWSGAGSDGVVEPPPTVRAVTEPGRPKTSPGELPTEIERPMDEEVSTPVASDEAADPSAVEKTPPAGDSAPPADAPATDQRTTVDGGPMAGEPAVPAEDSAPEPESSSPPRPAAAADRPQTEPSGASPAVPGGADAMSKPARDAAGEASPPPVLPESASGEGKTAPEAPEATPEAGADAAAEASAGPAVTRIIVAAEDVPQLPDAKSVASLDAACREAAALGVDTIELHFHGLREESPLDIASPRLRIRNGPGFQPTVVFRPGAEDLAGQRRMIRVGGGSLEWSGVHLRLELPPEPADGWALFSLQASDLLDLEDAVFTICNANAQGSLRQDRVSVVEWIDAPRGEPFDPASAEESVKRAIPPYIQLSNCVARGQATLIRCDKAVPLRISGRQCLLVLSEYLLDAGGRDTKPVQLDARIELALKHVTAALGKGLCRLRSDPGAPFQLDLVTDCKHSILYLTDANAALIERRGVRELAELEKRLYIRGRDNFYPGSDILLRLAPDGDPQTDLTYGFAGRSESWYQEESPRFSLMWKSLPSDDLPLDQHLPSDYLLDDSEHNPARYNGDAPHAGVDVSQLPVISDTEALPD